MSWLCVCVCVCMGSGIWYLYTTSVYNHLQYVNIITIFIPYTILDIITIITLYNHQPHRSHTHTYRHTDTHTQTILLHILRYLLLQLALCVFLTLWPCRLPKGLTSDGGRISLCTSKNKGEENLLWGSLRSLSLSCFSRCLEKANVFYSLGCWRALRSRRLSSGGCSLWALGWPLKRAEKLPFCRPPRDPMGVELIRWRWK